MIRINLALKKQAVGAVNVEETSAEKSRFSSLNLDSLSKMSSELNIRDFPLRRVLVPVVVGVLASFGAEVVKNNQLSALDKQLEDFKTQRALLVKEVARSKGLEELRTSLEADEKSIRNKINTIQQLINGRTTPPKLLMALAQNTPKEVWLSEFKVQGQDVSIKGYSLGFTQVSDLMKNLGETVYFADPVFKSSKQGKDDTGADVAIFDLAVKRRKEEAGR